MRECEQLGERLAASGVVGHRGWADQSMGRTCLLLGRLDEARRLGERAIESSPGHAGFAAHALALAEPRGMRPLVAHCHLGLGRLYQRTGTREQAHEHLMTATAMYREMDMPFWVEQAADGGATQPS